MLLHLLLEDICDDLAQLLALLLRQFTRFLRGSIQFRILIRNPLDGFCRCVPSHEERYLLDPLLWYQSKDPAPPGLVIFCMVIRVIFRLYYINGMEITAEILRM